MLLKFVRQTMQLFLDVNGGVEIRSASAVWQSAWQGWRGALAPLRWMKGTLLLQYVNRVTSQCIVTQYGAILDILLHAITGVKAVAMNLRTLLMLPGRGFETWDPAAS